MFKLRIEMGNAAFDQPSEELARILRGLADSAESGRIVQPGDVRIGRIQDANGNFCGEWSCELEGSEDA